MVKKKQPDLVRVNPRGWGLRKFRLGILSIVISLFFSQEAYAYLDPGSGSYILQLIIGIIVGVSFMIKTYWRKIINLFINLFSKQKKDKKNSD